MTGLQEALLRKAIHLTRPGGTIVYSTCTYAPEENEAILDRVLRYAAVTLEEIPLHLPHTPGVLAWEGQRFHPHIARAWRLYPHHMNSGGLFMARLRRRGIDHSVDSSASHRGTTPPNGWSEIPSGFPGEAEDAASVRIERAIDELVQWFDLSRSALDGVGWMVRNKHIWAQTAKIWPVAGWTGAVENRWRVVSVGLRALRGGPGRRETPSSHFLTRWAADIPDVRRVELHEPALRRLLEGCVLPTDLAPPGPVAIVWNGAVLGRGVVGPPEPEELEPICRFLYIFGPTRPLSLSRSCAPAQAFPS